MIRTVLSAPSNMLEQKHKIMALTFVRVIRQDAVVEDQEFLQEVLAELNASLIGHSIRVV